MLTTGHSYHILFFCLGHCNTGLNQLAFYGEKLGRRNHLLIKL